LTNGGQVVLTVNVRADDAADADLMNQASVLTRRAG
jgi:hypothetical protein